MAKRRMIHTKISRSLQVNQLSDFAKLVFTWTIPHLDDFGKIDGDPQILKATIMPLRDSSYVEKVEVAIQEMIKADLIIRYEVDAKKIIAFPKFDLHQSGGLGNRTESDYPDPLEENYRKLLEISRNYADLLAKRKQEKRKRNTKQDKGRDYERSDKSVALSSISPHNFTPSNESEEWALKAWEVFEPNKPWTFENTYLEAARKGLPIEKFEDFIRDYQEHYYEGEVDRPGGLFNQWVHLYFGTTPKKWQRGDGKK